MPVVINEFEIVPESISPPGEAAMPAPSTPAKAGGPTPEDVRHIMRTRDERAQRVFAH